jgi:hypothetical protein
VTCPTLANPTGQPASVFTPDPQPLTGLADGYYLLHYYAQDCAGTEELKFTQDGGGNWSTSFYTFPLNVDTTAPAVASGPTLSPVPSTPGTYNVGDTVMASYSCTDALSGVVRCGSQTFPAGTTSTGTLTAPVDTASPGSKVFTVLVVDAAGNQSSASVNYQVVSKYDSQIHFSISPTTVTYPQGANAAISIAPISAASSNIVPRATTASTRLAAKPASVPSLTPTGTVQILDGKKKIVTLTLHNGATSYNLRGLEAGIHSLSVVYSGDAHNPAGTSAPITFTVKPAPVSLHVECRGSTLSYGQDYGCFVVAASEGSIPTGVFTYKYDNGSAKTLPLFFGIGLFEIEKPAVGQHTIVVSYAAQGNYAAAASQTEKFTVTTALAKSHK